MKDGLISENGSYNELMMRKGIMANLVHTYLVEEEEMRSKESENILEQYLKDRNNNNTTVDYTPESAKALMKKEERNTGQISWKIIVLDLFKLLIIYRKHIQMEWVVLLYLLQLLSCIL